MLILRMFQEEFANIETIEDCKHVMRPVWLVDQQAKKPNGKKDFFLLNNTAWKSTKGFDIYNQYINFVSVADFDTMYKAEKNSEPITRGFMQTDNDAYHTVMRLNTVIRAVCRDMFGYPYADMCSVKMAMGPSSSICHQVTDTKLLGVQWSPPAFQEDLEELWQDMENQINLLKKKMKVYLLCKHGFPHFSMYAIDLDFDLLLKDAFFLREALRTVTICNPPMVVPSYDLLQLMRFGNGNLLIAARALNPAMNFRPTVTNYYLYGEQSYTSCDESIKPFWDAGNSLFLEGGRFLERKRPITA